METNRPRTGMTIFDRLGKEEKEETKQMSLIIKKPFHTWLKKEAAKRGMSMTKLIMNSVVFYLKENKDETQY